MSQCKYCGKVFQGSLETLQHFCIPSESKKISDQEKALLEAGFDHPCKGTCSGWKQGKERGYQDALKKSSATIDHLEARILEEIHKGEHYQEALKDIQCKNVFKDSSGLIYYGEFAVIAKEALEGKKK